MVTLVFDMGGLQAIHCTQNREKEHIWGSGVRLFLRCLALEHPW